MIQFITDKPEIFIIKYSGIISFDDVMASLLKFQSLDLNKDLKILNDTLDAELNFSPEELDEIYKLTNVISEKFNSFKVAYVVNKPKNTVISYLLLSMNNVRKTSKKTFFSYNLAINWLSQ